MVTEVNGGNLGLLTEIGYDIGWRIYFFWVGPGTPNQDDDHGKKDS